MSKLKILDLCSGIGGFSLGLEATGGFETIAFCEFDPFCQKVLNKHWPEVPIYNDLKEISKNEETIRNIPEHDLICGGIPCQPFSVAGKQKGKEDDRHLWPYMFKIIEQKKPTWVIVENVGGFVNVALDDVCLDLEAEGYATQSFIIPACGVEAPHRRDRIWIIGKRDVADSKFKSSNNISNSRSDLESQEERQETRSTDGSGSGQDVADSDSSLIEGGRISSGVYEENTNTNSGSTHEDVADSSSIGQQGQGQFGKWSGAETYGKRETSNAFSIGIDNQWRIEPRVGRVANGIPNRVDRLKSLGNAIVPQIIYHIGLAILKEEE